MAQTSSTPLAFVEIAPHSLQVVLLAGRQIVAMKTFALDAKADLAAFVAEHGVTGSVRAALIPGQGALHLAADSEAGAVRQSAALLAHAGKLPHGLGSPKAVAVDAASGLQPDPARATPWVMALADGSQIDAARDLLASAGLAPADLTLALPAHLGAVAAAAAPGESVLVVVPGEETAQLAWVGAQGVVQVGAAPLGYAAIYEAVQLGLGLKFKAAAGKLFYNENYDFADAAPKVAEKLAEQLRPVLSGRAASAIHVAGLTAAQGWLVEHLARSLGLKAWNPAASDLTSGLTGGKPSPATAAVLRLASAGSGDAPWISSTLDAIAARASRPAVPVAAPAAASAAAAPAAAKAAAPAKPAAPASAKPALRTQQPKAQPVVAVEVAETEAAPAPAPVAASAPARKSNKGPVMIAAAVGAVAIVVGVAMHFRSSSGKRVETVEAAAPAATTEAAPTATTPTPAPAATAPVVAPTPAPVVAAPSASAVADLSASDARRYSNNRYRFEVTEKGFIQALSTPRDEVLVESAAGITLQGSYVGTDGRRKWFNVGGVDDAGYQASVSKSVRNGFTVFDVKVTHPRFEIDQTFTCEADKVKVTARFKAINLRDPRGVIAAVHSVRLSPVALNPSLRMRAAADSFQYAMKAGTLAVGFDASTWGRDGADGRQTIVAGENGVAFHFTEAKDASRNVLNYEIAVP